MITKKYIYIAYIYITNYILRCVCVFFSYYSSHGECPSSLIQQISVIKQAIQRKKILRSLFIPTQYRAMPMDKKWWK